MIKHRYLQFKAKINYGLLSILPWHYCNLCKHFNRHIICNSCLNELPQINTECCSICKKTTTYSKNLCVSCSTQAPYFNQIISIFRYAPPLSHILHKYKYQKERKHHILLSYLLNFNEINPDNYDIIIPMPSHTNRINARGFDHIELLLSYWLLSPKYCTKIKFNTIIKCVDTEAQALNKLKSRNIQSDNIYKVNYDFIGLRVLIIDDVVTTANTVNNLAHFIKQNGAKVVDCCTLMRTVYD